MDKKSNTGFHVPCLDGLRALSIALVVALHYVQRNSVLDPSGLWMSLRPFANGYLGVFIFFVISGYLITSLLLHEFDAYGTIDLRKFYLKRAFRILPPLYVYVLFLGILTALGVLALQWKEILSTLVFIRNYSEGLSSTPSGWTLEHTWSLCVEEQFYFLWPPLLLWVLRRKGRLAAAKVAIGIIVASPFIRIGMFLLHTSYSTPAYLGAMLHTRADALMYGCAAALLSDNYGFERLYIRLSNASWFRWIAAMQIFIVSPVLYAKFKGLYLFTIGFTIDGFCVAFLMMWCTRNKESITGRILESKFMVHVGVLSYSLYIWQTLFLHPMNRSFLASFPSDLAMIMLAAEISRYCVEKPSLKMRDFLVKRWFSSERLKIAMSSRQ